MKLKENYLIINIRTQFMNQIDNQLVDIRNKKVEIFSISKMNFQPKI